MNTFLISYDLGSPETYNDYIKLIDHIKSYSRWAKPLKSVWLIKTSKMASEVRSEIKSVVDSNDKALVIDVTGANWASYNISKEVSDWMKNNL